MRDFLEVTINNSKKRKTSQVWLSLGPCFGWSFPKHPTELSCPLLWCVS